LPSEPDLGELRAAPEETEVKLRLDSPGAGREALKKIGAALRTPRHHEDNVLLDDADLRLAATGSALRLRRASGGATITFKGPRRVVEGAKRRIEIETEVADPDAAAALLEALGFRRVFRYEKHREIYAWREVVLSLDETPIGTFLEIEGPLAAIHAAAEALGVSQSDYVAESYVDLFLEGGGQGDLVFR
jgi:adenylate cyclase, class 2